MADNTTVLTLTPQHITRFWYYVDRSDEGCWEWTGSRLKRRNTRTYGVVSFNGKSYSVHRIAWLLCNGEVPDGMYVCHRCDNPGCVRPDHLFIGTPKDNHDDMKQKGRAPRGEMSGRVKHPDRWDRGLKGEAHPNAKLTEKDVHHIRRRFQQITPYRSNSGEIAKDYGVSSSIIRNIGLLKTWTHVPVMSDEMTDDACP